MAIPKSSRVIYGKNPLVEVTCQLKFPPVLRIAAESPAEFQDEIRQRYPLFQQNAEHANWLPPELAQHVPAEFRPAIASAGLAPVFEFSSADHEWTITVSNSSFMLSTKNYGTWERFKEYLGGPLEHFVRIYKPAFYQRIGLRYRDEIRRTSLGLASATWSDLLRREICGELASEIHDDIVGAVRQFAMRVENGLVRARHGLIQFDQGTEIGYGFDFDFYLDAQTEVASATPLLDSFNRQCGNLFRWCISDRLHQAMEPRGI